MDVPHEGAAARVLRGRLQPNRHRAERGGGHGHPSDPVACPSLYSKQCRISGGPARARARTSACIKWIGDLEPGQTSAELAKDQ